VFYAFAGAILEAYGVERTGTTRDNMADGGVIWDQ
jgi:hypothetical protein